MPISINMIPIDSKITNFSLYQFVCFSKTSAYCLKKKVIIIILSLCMPSYKIHLPVHFIFKFSAHYKERKAKGISRVNPAITENTECLIA